MPGLLVVALLLVFGALVIAVPLCMASSRESRREEAEVWCAKYADRVEQVQQ